MSAQQDPAGVMRLPHHLPVQQAEVTVTADPDSAFFWDGLAAGTLLLPRCDRCRRHWFPPAPRCPHCGCRDWQPVPSAGTGLLYSWVITHHAFDPAFGSDLPYPVGIVALDEGPRLPGRLLDVDTARLRADLPVRAVVHHAGGQPLLGFVPREPLANTPASQ